MAPPDADADSDTLPRGVDAQAFRHALSRHLVSRRAATNISRPNLWGPLEKALSNPWSSENTDGAVIMRIAENSLMHDRVAEFIEKTISVDKVNHLTYGQGPRGSPRLRAALASFLTGSFGAREPVTSDQILVMSGLTGVMEAFTWCVCDDGEGIMIAQPLYTGYEVDITQKTRGVLVPVPFGGVEGYDGFDDAFRPGVSTRAFERALRRSEEEGVRVRAVVLSNPHNPLGVCYPAAVLKEMAQFCGQHSIHLVSNEIYAHSTFANPKAPDAAPFTSMLSLDVSSLIDPSLVHVFYGASKDFCMNGLRLGMMQSRNEGLLAAMTSVAPFSWTPYIVQDLWAAMLEDRKFLTEFFARNKRLLSEHYIATTALLEENGIPYYAGNAGLFLWMDLRRYIQGDADASALRRDGPHSHVFKRREAAIDEAFLRNDVCIAQGSVFFTEEWGWFRLSFTLPRQAIETGVARMMKALREVQSQGWQTMSAEKSSERIGAVARHLDGRE